jgi:putative colanic acid biosysnthesis UDP-glucose lipid carrier transferase
MSLVGPRPHPVNLNEKFRKIVPGYMLRHKVRPGITGLAQLKGYRGETDTTEKMEKRVEYDLRYLREWTVLLDIEILLRTVFVFLFQRKAY